MPDTRKEKLESVLAALDERKAKMTRDQMMEVLGGKRQGRLNMPVAPRDGVENLPYYGEEGKKEVLPQIGEPSNEVELMLDVRKDGVRQPAPRRKMARSNRLYEMMR
jgi:predicted N-formylglutamate amidohydrolase